jgi:hypothetical protein
MGRIEDVHMIVMHMTSYYFTDHEEAVQPGSGIDRTSRHGLSSAANAQRSELGS